MKLFYQNFIVTALLMFPILLSSQQFTLDFSDATVDCDATTVCYDVTILANGAGFGLGSYNLRLFYDGSRINYLTGSPNINNLPPAYAIGGVQNVVGNLSGNAPATGLPFGNLPFDASLGFLEFGVDYIPSTPQAVTGTASNILQNLCFTIADPTLLSDNASCFDLIWVTENSREDYTNAVTTLNNATAGTTADLTGSTYIDLTMATNCLVDACVMDPCVPIIDADGDGVCDVGAMPDPDPQDPCVPDANNAACAASMIVYELDFTDGVLDCQDQIICYDITIEAPVDFDLGSYNLRLFYDGDLIDLIDASPNLAAGTQLGTSYAITSVTDTQGGDMTGNGSLPFEDNIDLIDIAVNYLGANPINATTTPTIITNDLCFTIVDPAVIDDPAVCIHAVWVTNATEEGYTVGETTVNVAIGNGVTTDIDNSIYNDLDPSGANCFEGACVEVIPTMGEWGLISLALILMIFGVVALRSENTITTVRRAE